MVLDEVQGTRTEAGSETWPILKNRVATTNWHPVHRRWSIPVGACSSHRGRNPQLHRQTRSFLSDSYSLNSVSLGPQDTVRSSAFSGHNSVPSWKHRHACMHAHQTGDWNLNRRSAVFSPAAHTFHSRISPHLGHATGACVSHSHQNTNNTELFDRIFQEIVRNFSLYFSPQPQFLATSMLLYSPHVV